MRYAKWFILSKARKWPYSSHRIVMCRYRFKDNLDIDLQRSKHIIGQHCPSLYYAGLSLSGKGIFLIFRISNPKFHKQHFEALALFLKNKFGLQVDNNVKSPVSRDFLIDIFLTISYNKSEKCRKAAQTAAAL